MKKYIKSDGSMNDDGKKICKEKNITSFKGKPEDSTTNIELNEKSNSEGAFETTQHNVKTGDNLDTNEHININKDNVQLTHQEIEFKTELDEIDNIDISMEPELEEYLSLPPEEATEGLMSNILDGLPEDFYVDNDIFDTMLNLTEESLNFLE